MSTNIEIKECFECDQECLPSDVIDYGSTVICRSCGEAKGLKPRYYRVLVSETIAKTILVKAWSKDQAETIAEFEPEAYCKIINRERTEVFAVESKRITKQQYKEKKGW